jgi:hypothetical protein
MATIAANYHASNFTDDVAPVKLMSAGSDAKTRCAFETVWKIQPDARSKPLKRHKFFVSRISHFWLMPWIREGKIRTKKIPRGFRLVFGGGLRGGDFVFGFGDDDIMLVGKQIGEAARSSHKQGGRNPILLFYHWIRLKITQRLRYIHVTKQLRPTSQPCE